MTNWGPLIPQVSTVPFDSLPALEAEIAKVGRDKVAAFFCEPVVGAGGVLLPPEGYIQGVADLCAEHGILLVIDSVICGFGRLGTWFGIERSPDVVPDMITFAKGVTSGYIPLGGVVVATTSPRRIYEPGGPMLRHGATYAGHPAACAAGMAVLDIYEAEDLIARGQRARAAARRRVGHARRPPGGREIRAGLGFLAAVGVPPDADPEQPPGCRGRPRGGRARARVARRRGDVAAAHHRAGTPRVARRGTAGRARPRVAHL